MYVQFCIYQEEIHENESFCSSVVADFSDYCRAHNKVDTLFADRQKWNNMSLMNIAKSGIFAADRSIKDYAENIWNVKPVNK